MKRSSILLATLATLASLLVGGDPAVASTGTGADQPQAADSVVVTGTGTVFAEPDLLIADFAVETAAPTVSDALSTATAAATRMRDALVRAGVARADLQTANAGITARLNDDRVVTGYTVNLGLTARIRNLARGGALLSAAIAAGGDAARLNGVSFTVENDAAPLAEARRKAFADAREKASLYAREAGRTLGRVVRVSEGPVGFGGAGGGDSMAAADLRLPIEPGRQRLAATVTVEWAFAPAR